MSSRAEIWAILREVYKFSSDTPMSDNQIEVVDRLDRYFKGTYKPVVKFTQPDADNLLLQTPEKKPVVMVTLPDGTTKPRGRGRPRKGT